MTQPNEGMRPDDAAPIARMSDGTAIYAPGVVPPGHAQPLGVLADGQPVWPLPPGASAAPGQTLPFGLLSSGQPVWAEAVTPKKPLYKKKRVLVPVVALTLAAFGGGLGNEPAEPATAAPASASTSREQTPMTEEERAAILAAGEKTAAENAAAVAESERAAAAAAKEAADKAAAEKAAADKAAAEKAAADKAAAEKAAAEQRALANPTRLSARDFAMVVKDPDAHTGRYYVVYGEVTQFDAATGDSAFLADSGGERDDLEYGFTAYSDNTLYQGDPALLSAVVEGDVFQATVKVLGSESYDTQIGGNTTVPKFEIVDISVYGSTL